MMDVIDDKFYFCTEYASRANVIMRRPKMPLKRLYRKTRSDASRVTVSYSRLSEKSESANAVSIKS